MKVMLILCLFLASCIPEIPKEAAPCSYFYNIMLVRNDGKMIQEFYANNFSVYGGVLHVWDTSLDKREHYFLKSDDVMIEIIKIK
jgi:hypothetical protein